MFERIGRYEIQDELGRGGFGRVYRAYDPSVKRSLAIKILTSEPDPEVLERFRHEAGTTGNLTHNNIVRIYEYGEHEGTPYIAMELLEGDTLQKVIESQRPLTLLEKVDIMQQVADGLAAARAKGVIHRDIKPANIMLLPSGVVKIMDFGISRVVDKDGSRHTRQGDLVGTLLYMSPEQFQGVDADEITDIFAYGVVYYELLTGVHPFAGNDAGAVMFRITTVEPPPIHGIVADCPEALEQTVRRTMAKNRELRTRSFNEIVLDSSPILHEMKTQRAAALMKGIEEMVELWGIDSAQARIRQVLELDAFNPEARRWRRTLQDRIDRQAKDAKVVSLLREGDEKMEARQFQEALRCFEAALHLDKSNAGAQERQQRATAAVDTGRKAALLISEARSNLQHRHLDIAIEKATQAIEVEPQNPAWASFLEMIQKQVADQRLEPTAVRESPAPAAPEIEPPREHVPTQTIQLPPAPTQLPPAPIQLPPRPRRSRMAAIGLALLLAAVGGGVWWLRTQSAEKKITSAKTTQPQGALVNEIRDPNGDMVLVPGGPFLYGKTKQPRELSAFYIDKLEVSNKAYARYAKATKTAPPSGPSGNPVVKLTVEQARGFCLWAEKTLPTTEQWEKAGRGTGGRVYPWGNDADPNKANVSDRPGRHGVMPVNSFAKYSSPYGVLNMAGNVWEFTSDARLPTAEEIKNANATPSEASQLWPVIHGGSYKGSIRDAELWDNAVIPPASQQQEDIGFRCAKPAR